MDPRCLNKSDLALCTLHSNLLENPGLIFQGGVYLKKVIFEKMCYMPLIRKNITWITELAIRMVYFQDDQTLVPSLVFYNLSILIQFLK